MTILRLKKLLKNVALEYKESTLSAMKDTLMDVRFGTIWAIPTDTIKPSDKRIISGKYLKNKEGGFAL